MADMIDSGKISFACELDKDLETPTTESNTEARITFTETQIVLGLGNDKSIKYKATGQGTDLSNYYNRSEVDEKLKLKADKTQLGDYYNKGEIDSSLGNKVDTTTLTTDYYNKTETDNLLRNKADTTVLENYYNKSDIDGKLANKVDTTTLDNYDLSTEVDNKVKVVSDKVGDLSTLETGVKNTVVAAINEVKRAQTEAGKVTNLNDLGDVNASSPRRGQFLGWDQDTLKWVSKDVETNGMDTHMADFSNPHRTTISNLNDTTISTPKANQVLVYNGTKWINKDVSLDDSNYAKKNEANIFTKKQSGIDGTEDANFVTLKQLKTKVGLTGNETIAGTKTFSSPVVVPNATAATHAINKGQFDSSISTINTNIGSINTTLGNKVTKTGNETIAGVKTFSVPPISATNPTANNQVSNKGYVDTVGGTKVALSGNQTIAGTKTFSAIPICSVTPTANNHLVNKMYVDGLINSSGSGAVTLKGTRTTRGTWSITGLKVGAPLYILCSNTSAGTLRCTSGSIDGEASANQFYEIGIGTSTNVFVVIPTVTTVTIEVSASAPILRAYQ